MLSKQIASQKFIDNTREKESIKKKPNCVRLEKVTHNLMTM